MTYQGRSTPSNPIPATTGQGSQMEFIGDLMQNHQIPDEPRHDHREEDSLMLERVFDVAGGKTIWRHEASELIDWLKALPMKPGAQPKPRSGYRRGRSYSSPPAAYQQPAGRSHKDVATEALSLLRQLDVDPGRRAAILQRATQLEQELYGA